jgi:quercetin dioxygenase-like cupin family protein
MKQMLAMLALLFAVVLFTGKALAQDATKVDPKHYKVEFENDQVRVLRITYGPHEKSVMHSHPEGMVIFLTDAKGKFTFPDGKTQENSWKAGDFSWVPASSHDPENLGDKAFSLIQIEMKSKKKSGPAPSKK